jgi:hypothetical protein
MNLQRPAAEISTIFGIAMLTGALYGALRHALPIDLCGTFASAGLVLVGIRQTPTAVKGPQETAPGAPPVETKRVD